MTDDDDYRLINDRHLTVLSAVIVTQITTDRRRFVRFPKLIMSNVKQLVNNAGYSTPWALGPVTNVSTAILLRIFVPEPLPASLLPTHVYL